MYQLQANPSSTFQVSLNDVAKPNNTDFSTVVCNVFASSNETCTFDIWDRRLGHPSSDVLTHCLNSYNVSLAKNKTSSVCHAYALEKSRKLPFQLSQATYCNWSLGLNPMLLIRISTLCLFHWRFFYTYLDIFSQKEIWCSSILSYLQTVSLALVRIQSKATPKWRRISKFPALSSEICHSTPPVLPDTSEQNGLVERKHRQIIEMGLALLAQASLPLSYWMDAFFLLCILLVYCQQNF